MAHPVVHFEIAGKDGEALKEFYGSLFGWSIKAFPGMETYLGVDTKAEGVGIGGGLFQTPPEMPNYVTFYVDVESLEEYLAKAEVLGGKTVVPPTPIPDMGSFAMFADPEGNLIGLWKS